jgi:hypothetical protein
VGFIPGKRFGLASENQLIHHSNIIKPENYVTMSVDTKTFWQKPSFHDKHSKTSNFPKGAPTEHWQLISHLIL